jgi:hypothetical protein
MVLADSHGISRVPRYSGTCPASQRPFVYRAVTVYGRSFLDRSTRVLVCDSPALRPGRPYNPRVHARGFGLFRVRSPLLTESRLFSVPAGTEMVHFPALPSTGLWIQPGISRDESGGVSPFGNLRVEACLRLTGAYRSLPRPSSPSCAKASTVRP